jgi:hypothetical protein
MTVYNPQAKDRINRVPILVVAAAASLLGGLVFTLRESLMPGWLVYPFLPIIALGLMCRRPITWELLLAGCTRLFLLFYLPFTLLAGAKGSPCPDCSRTLLWVTLFIFPLLAAFAAIMAWQQVRRREVK